MVAGENAVGAKGALGAMGDKNVSSPCGGIEATLLASV